LRIVKSEHSQAVLRADDYLQTCAERGQTKAFLEWASGGIFISSSKDDLTLDYRHHARKKAAARAQIDAFRMPRYSLLTIEE
jgi:hypothetical protein